MTRATEELEKMIAEQPARRGPRVPFHRLCAAYFAIHRGFERSDVAKAFGLSQSSISHLSNCVKGPHYPAVAREFSRLGEQEFGAQYLDDETIVQLQKIRLGVAEPRDFPMRRADEKADKYSREKFGPFDVERIDGSIVTVEVGFRGQGDVFRGEPLPPGWTWRECADPDGWTKAKRHRISYLAYDAAFEDHGQDSPRKRP